MAYVTVPKDLTHVKSKVLFGLTKRQLVCFGGALLTGGPLYFLTRDYLSNSAAALLMIFAMLPGLLFALFERHGQPLEVVIQQMIQCCFIRPKLEQKLQRYLDTYEATHNYDEYHFYLDEIEHDPYVLISILSALHDGVFTLAEVQGELEMLFEKQYILTETVTMQIRYRTKMMVIIGPYGVPQVITYQEPYEYYICTVKLKNKDLSHLPVEVLTEEQLSAYSLYMRTLGNRPDLFGKAQYPNASTIKQPTYYDIPPEALKDDKFSAMMEEATKYIGYPYVWGGSSPSTSFDCSGYISWVLNHSGWNVGRQTAQGLYNLCTPVSAAQVKPGDLVFFKGTYDTPGVSHCGIYVGNSIMLHCGDPISYTNLNSKYWQEHFYSYGRLP